ncbi:MAG: hypothetical protein NC299_12375 [Lachnospiraceae bacterium]|nr:hypothetical protein [Ruminococcus sp.]MCM1276137.1 hypothetical protein [Lachnospiraceae bacterium]
MRITNPTILRGYNRDLNRLLNLKSQTEKRITSGRKFARASEAPLSAAKALNVRKSLYFSAQYKENLKVADKFYTEAETSLLQVSEKMAEIRETIIAAVNTTKDLQDYNIYAQQLETNARKLCSIFNTDSAGRAIFGGESDDTSPFDIIDDANGNASTVLYHGIPVNALSDYKQFPYSKEVNLDIGLGMDIDQETQEVDPQSVLKISFHGTEVTGCGAQYGVADVDLSQIKNNRSYCIDVYAGNVKKTIQFTGKGSDQQANIDAINAELEKAFKKQEETGEGYPRMDEQGVIALFKDELDDDGKTVINKKVPVEDGICCVVNNKEKNPRAETLVVDNDSGYTNKYKVNVDTLEDGRMYTISVAVGNETAKDVTFKTSSADDPETRDAETLDNIQAALDEAFGAGRVNISKGKVTQGVITSEGSTVKVYAQEDKVSSTALKATITTESTARFDLSKIVAPNEYRFTAEGTKTYDITLAAGTTFSVANFNSAMAAAGVDCVMDANGMLTKADGSPFTDITCENVTAGTSVPLTKKTDYSIDLGNMTEGGTYQLKVVNGTSVKTVSFKAGADEAATLANLTDALKGTGATLTNEGNGIYKFNDGIAVANPVVSSRENPVVEKESIYSNNYIQLTLDAARALRQGDIAYANGCIDRIVSANEKLLVEIANLGCNEDFISFNLDRITTREENLQERQTDLEATDAKSEITLWKTYEAMYNACLQMSSSVVPNSIFNYIK